MNKYAFIDRDGVLIFEPPDTKQIDSLDKLIILPRAVENLLRLQNAGYKLLIISNQDGLGTKSFPQNDFDLVQAKLLNNLELAGIKFYKIFVCPHLPSDNCNCRKPRTGLLDDFLINEPWDKEKSFLIGDRESDKMLAQKLGIKYFSMPTNGQFSRLGILERQTLETKIFCLLNLDGQGNFEINSGIKFFDHLLEQLAKNALLDLKLSCQGDLLVDEHHTVEDIGLVLGEALSQTLGDKRGIERYGFILPMDEALAEVAIDLGGRPYLIFNAKFKREKIGDLPTELIQDFFQALSVGLKANIHINLRYGRNEHHKAESIFKCFGRALCQAIKIGDRQAQIIPSTKGVI